MAFYSCRTARFTHKPALNRACRFLGVRAIRSCLSLSLNDNVLDKRLKISYAIARHKLPDNGKRNEPLFPGGMGRAAKEGTESWKNF